MFVPSMFCAWWDTVICLFSGLLEQDSIMTELMINRRQDKCPWFNMHNYTWQDEHSEPRQAGSVRRWSCVADKQEINLLPESVQKGRSVSKSLPTRRKDLLCIVLGRLWLVSVPKSFVRLIR